MTDPEASTVAPPRVLDTGALRALAHPMRIRIYDLLSQHGPQTASSLAEALGESSGATSYHLRALAKHDLIREVEGKGTARERWWERPRGSITMSNASAIKSPAGRAASQLVITEMYRQRNDQLMRYLEAGMKGGLDDLDGELSTATARLTRAQFEALAARLQKIIHDTVEKHRDQDGDDVAVYSIRLDMIPLDFEGASGKGAS